MAGDPQVPASPSWTINVSDVRNSTIYLYTESYTLGHYIYGSQVLHLRQSVIIATLGPVRFKGITGKLHMFIMLFWDWVLGSFPQQYPSNMCRSLGKF
jgi:hypothetical protein